MKKLSEIYRESNTGRYFDHIALGKRVEADVIAENLDVKKHINISILSSSTSNGIKEILVSECACFDVFAHIYEGEYGQYAQQIFNPNSSLYASNPELVIINIDTQTLAGDSFFVPYKKSDQERKEWVEETLNLLSGMVTEICKQISAKIVLHNLEIPSYSPLGIIENKESYGYIESIEDINRALRDKYKMDGQVYIYDYNNFCSKHGKNNLQDAKLYYMGDVKIKPQYVLDLCVDYVEYVQALASYTKKCIVLDLDNTLWGGIIGEDGLEGIQLGPTPEGRPFMEFQQYLYALYQRGVILVINSKNNFYDAIDVIRNHPYMILKEECFAAMQINWQDKVSNMKLLAQEINIGLDSCVFFDDDPLNREMVKEFLPEVDVIDLPKDSSLYVDALKEMRYFDTLTLTKEDKQKGEMYHAEKKRKKLVKTTNNLTEYLRMLDMTVYIEEANKHNIPRISQLTQKTNQFNLTTKRYSEEQITRFSNSHLYHVVSISLKDKFGDNGLTGLAIIEKNNSQSIWRIDTFLLSCRILGRCAENILLAYLIEKANKSGIKHLRGEFVPTKKNIAAAEFYQLNGFIKLECQDRVGDWEYNLDNNYNYPDFINYKILHENKNE